MSSIAISLDIKTFQLLIKGIIQIVYFSDNQNSITIREELITKLYSNSELDGNEIKNEVELFENIIRKAGYENWTDEQLKDFLFNNQFPDEHLQLFVNNWSRESSKIHQTLLHKVTFNNVMDNIAWRVDIEAMNKSTKDINESGKAYFELQFHRGSNNTNKSVAKFEMDRTEVASMVEQLGKIELALQTLASSS